MEGGRGSMRQTISPSESKRNWFWGYKRTIALAMENNDFRKTGPSSVIHYELPQK
jgi:hypothetical protein